MDTQAEILQRQWLQGWYWNFVLYVSHAMFPGAGCGTTPHSLFGFSCPLVLRVRWKIERLWTDNKGKFATEVMPRGQSTTSCHIVYFIDIINSLLTVNICDKILQSIARRFDVSRTSLSSESKIIKSSLYSEEMNKFKKKALKGKQRVWL